uniref:Uncharacterized protein n=1 Tax=Arundo donax TaxID=35708 RepID=A0A0A9EZV1_ARUDO
MVEMDMRKSPACSFVPEIRNS